MSGDTFFQRFIGAYTSNQCLTISGRTPEGNDATNDVTYMCLQSAARHKLHDPTLSLCLHKDSPIGLFEADIETAKIVGGIPTLENTDLIIDILHKRGLSIEDARNFCVVGCVEITGSGCEFANPSAPFSNTFININSVLLQAISWTGISRSIISTNTSVSERYPFLWHQRRLTAAWKTAVISWPAEQNTMRPAAQFSASGP